MDDGRAKQLHIYAEDKIQVQDNGGIATPFPRALSHYLSPDISSRLVNSGSPRTLATIDQEIVSVNAIIESLRVLQILKCQARNGCAPISRLPPEILGEIFITCIDCDDNREWERAAELDFCLILGQVCSAWRSVAWGLPMLWTNVHCRVSHPKNSKKLATLLFQWLLRAQDLPISVKIDFQDEEAWAKLGNNAPIEILEALTPFYHGFRVLDLVLPASWVYHLSTLDSWHLYNLEKLRIRPPAPIQYHEIDIDGFFYSPKLCSISYQSYQLQNLHLPWMNLTEAAFGGPSLDEIVELLRRCTDLVTCHISDPIPDEQVYPISPIAHSRIQELHLKFSTAGPSPPVEIDILNLLTAPLLREISLQLPPDHTSPLPDILELNKRSQCPLITVEVFGPAISEEHIIEFLSDSTVVRLHYG